MVYVKWIYIYDSSVDDVIERYVNSYDKSYNVFYKRVKDYHDEKGTFIRERIKQR